MNEEKMAEAIKARFGSKAPERYKIRRQKVGTQAQVARMLGVSRETISRRESGTFAITHEAWIALESLKPKRATVPKTVAQ